MTYEFIERILQVGALNRIQLPSSKQCNYFNNVRDAQSVKYKSTTQLISNCNERLSISAVHFTCRISNVMFGGEQTFVKIFPQGSGSGEIINGMQYWILNINLRSGVRTCTKEAVNSD